MAAIILQSLVDNYHNNRIVPDVMKEIKQKAPHTPDYPIGKVVPC
jgi:hypothetical protein